MNTGVTRLCFRNITQFNKFSQHLCAGSDELPHLPIGRAPNTLACRPKSLPAAQGLLAVEVGSASDTSLSKLRIEQDVWKVVTMADRFPLWSAQARQLDDSDDPSKVKYHFPNRHGEGEKVREEILDSRDPLCFGLGTIQEMSVVVARSAGAYGGESFDSSLFPSQVPLEFSTRATWTGKQLDLSETLDIKFEKGEKKDEKEKNKEQQEEEEEEERDDNEEEEETDDNEEVKEQEEAKEDEENKDDKEDEEKEGKKRESWRQNFKRKYKHLKDKLAKRNTKVAPSPQITKTDSHGSSNPLGPYHERKLNRGEHEDSLPPDTYYKCTLAFGITAKINLCDMWGFEDFYNDEEERSSAAC